MRCTRGEMAEQIRATLADAVRQDEPRRQLWPRHQPAEDAKGEGAAHRAVELEVRGAIARNAAGSHRWIAACPSVFHVLHTQRLVTNTFKVSDKTTQM